MKRVEHSQAVLTTNFQKIDNENPREKVKVESSNKQFEGDFFKDFYYSQGNYNEEKITEKNEQGKVAK